MISAFFLFFVSFLVSSHLASSPTQLGKIELNLWPQPVSFQSGAEILGLEANNFQFKANVANEILEKAFQRYKTIIFGKNPSKWTKSFSSNNNVIQLMVNVKHPSIPLQFGVNEAYVLNISAPISYLDAETVYGALHGLETFSQAVTSVPSSNEKTSFYTRTCLIQDSPRFLHRGLLIDSSRHYLPVDTILRAIDSLAYSKFNVLHWHIVDAISFPVQSQAFPNLSKAAWSPNEVYSHQDIIQVVQYASERGIRVIPEFDTPGHAYSWGVGYPGITADCPSLAYNPNNIALNPSNPFTFELLEGFFKEILQLFPDNFFHIGGDEVVYRCFEEDKNITHWMQQNGIATYNQLMQYYEQKLWKIVGDNKKSPIAWEEIFNAYGLSLPSEIIIEVWKDEPTLYSVASSNLRGILAYGWYLDHLNENWKDFYQHEPFESSEWTRETEEKIIGGEVCAWGEYLNQYNFDQRVWPRTAAAGERLWSPKDVTDIQNAERRLQAHICRLNARGIGAAPISPGTCY